MSNDEATLSLKYNNETLEFVFPTKAQVSPLVNRLRHNVKRYFQSLDTKFGPMEYIVDVGACVGTWTIPFALYFPEAKILAIEPSKYNHPYLRHNCKNYPNIKTIKMAASDIKGKVTIANPTPVQRDRSDLGTNTGLISIHGNSDNFREEVEMDMLDNLVESRVDWLKIDIEGHEKFVLEGAQNILECHKPILQIEMREQTQRLVKSTTFLLANLISSYGYIAIGSIDDDWVFAPQEKA